QVVQAPRRADADLQPLPPRQRRLVGAVQVAPQRAFLHVLVHQDHLRLLAAVADERHQVPVPDAGQHHDLRLELRQPLLRGAGGALHRHGRAVTEHALVHVPETAHADEVALVEVVRGGLDLRQRDVQLHAHPLHPAGLALSGPPVLQLLSPDGGAVLGVRHAEKAEHHASKNGGAEHHLHRNDNDSLRPAVRSPRAQIDGWQPHDLQPVQYAASAAFRRPADADGEVPGSRRPGCVVHVKGLVRLPRLRPVLRRELSGAKGLRDIDVEEDANADDGAEHLIVAEVEADEVAGPWKLRQERPRDVEVEARGCGLQEVRHVRRALRLVHHVRRHLLCVTVGRGVDDRAGGRTDHRLPPVEVGAVGEPRPPQRVVPGCHLGPADVEAIHRLKRLLLPQLHVVVHCGAHQCRRVVPQQLRRGREQLDSVDERGGAGVRGEGDGDIAANDAARDEELLDHPGGRRPEGGQQGVGVEDRDSEARGQDVDDILRGACGGGGVEGEEVEAQDEERRRVRRGGVGEAVGEGRDVRARGGVQGWGGARGGGREHCLGARWRQVGGVRDEGARGGVGWEGDGGVGAACEEE
uniref:Uncharacterized protein n=1 Tax=Triticum urartu TaxID=4572 RepID=A0A8R7QNF9_TRIUA